MDSPFNYRRIGQQFDSELADLIGRRRSVVLLGLRDLGKRFALRTLSLQVKKEDAALLVEVEFPHEPALAELSAFQRLIERAVLKAAPDFDLKPNAEDELLAALRQLSSAQRRPVVLLASNVDSMAHHLAQVFLREARVLVGNNGLTAVLTGEENLRDLVYGPDSEFNCAEQFVIQGFDTVAFMDYMGQRGEITQLRFADKAACLLQLFNETGGNIHLARAALSAFLEARARRQEPTDKQVGTEEFKGFLDSLPVSDVCDVDVFLHSIRVVDGAPTAWKELKLLLGGGPVRVPLKSPPHPLELAGLAVREAEQLHFASPIIQRFAERQYDNCRLGDLHAVNGDWETAFEFYQQMAPARRIRPCGADDRTHLALVVKALAGKLHEEATQKGEPSLEKLEHVKKLFTKGCELVLGFSEVTFWTYSGDWKLLGGQKIEPGVANLARLILGGTNREEIGWQAVPSPLNQRGTLAVLPSVRPDLRDAVVVSDSLRPVAVSRERAEFLRDLLGQFTSAYDHTIVNWGTRLRLEARAKHLAVATSIIDALGSSVRNPREALAHAGKALLQLGYRRIMFSLVDPARTRITGTSDAVGEPSPANVAAETDFPLDRPHADIQPWVVLNKRPCVVPDWRTWGPPPGMPEIPRELCRRAGHGPFAVVPMFIRKPNPDGTPNEEVFGTIHVERQDGLPPSREDIDDLIEFGRQMAAAANQSERVDMLLRTLHCDQDSLVVVDHEGNVRFVNRNAAARFQLCEGWHEARERLRFERPEHREFHDATMSVITTGKRIARHHVAELGGPRREAIICQPLPDWRVEHLWRAEEGGGSGKGLAGAILQIHDLTPLNRVFTALQHVADQATDQESTVAALLACMRDLGYSKARLYLVERQAGEVLTSVRAMGAPPNFANEFENGRYRMERHDPNRGDTWLCLEQGQPRIHLWNPSRETGFIEPTEQGLAAFNVQHPGICLPGQRPGEFWIDLPLIANRRPIGKLSIDCGKEFKCDLTPENFELLKLFSALLGAVLEALDRKEKWMRDAADKAMATCAHNIRTKLAALDGFAERYRRAAQNNARVEELNQLHQPAVDACFRQVTRIKETFAGIQLQRAPIHVKPLLEAALEGMFGKERDVGKVVWELRCPENLEFSLDADRIRNALEEMLANSLAMIPPGTRLKLGVVAETETRGLEQWLRLTLRDNGPGVPADKRERIFEPFYSDRPHGRRSTGLGLNFVRRVVEAHNGRVWVTGAPNHGAEFIIEIPNPKE